MLYLKAKATCALLSTDTNYGDNCFNFVYCFPTLFDFSTGELKHSFLVLYSIHLFVAWQQLNIHKDMHDIHDNLFPGFTSNEDDVIMKSRLLISVQCASSAFALNIFIVVTLLKGLLFGTCICSPLLKEEQ